jgi:hypothetical protein
VKKIIAFLVLALFSFTAVIYAQNLKFAKQEKIAIQPPQDKLTVGETLEYSMEWLGIPVGLIVLGVAGIEKIDGHPCYHITARATPNKFLTRFYDVEYRVHTYLDIETLSSRRFEKIRRTGKSFLYVISEFNQEKHLAGYYYYHPKGPIDKISFSSVQKNCKPDIYEEVKISPNTQDLFSSLYYFRLMPIEPNKSYTLDISYERNTWPVDIKLVKLFQKEIRRKGSFSAMEVYPDSALSDNVLGKRQISVILTTDSRRIPLEFRLHSVIGFIRGVIKNPKQ